MNKIQDVDYLYATARLRALEKNMLTTRDLTKMVDAATLEESYKVANDISLRSSLGFRQYEQAIADMLAGTYALIAELMADGDVEKSNEGLFDLFRLKYDGHNLKTLIKAQALGSDPAAILSPLGTVPTDRLTAQLRDNKLEGLPARIIDAAYQARETLAKSGDPQQVDILLDKAVMESMSHLAGEIGFPFLTDLVRTMIDVENLRTEVRLKRMGKDIGLLRTLLVEGGKLDPARLCAVFGSEGFDSLREMLAFTDYGAYFGPLLDALGPRSTLTAFERGADDFILAKLRSSRLVAFGLEPVVSYLLAKENEAKLIRIILASKAAGVERDKIKERLRETYA